MALPAGELKLRAGRRMRDLEAGRHLHASPDQHWGSRGRAVRTRRRRRTGGSSTRPAIERLEPHRCVCRAVARGLLAGLALALPNDLHLGIQGVAHRPDRRPFARGLHGSRYRGARDGRERHANRCLRPRSHRPVYARRPPAGSVVGPCRPHHPGSGRRGYGTRCHCGGGRQGHGALGRSPASGRRDPRKQWCLEPRRSRAWPAPRPGFTKRMGNVPAE